MKKRFLATVYFICCIFLCVAARGNAVPMSVAVHSGQTLFDDNALRLLGSKMKALLSANGISSAGYCGIVLCPTVDVGGKQVIEGGMRNITVFDFQLSLTVVNVVTGNEFGTMSMPLRGEGYSERDACLTALRKINAADKRFAGFLEESSKRVEDYYTKNTSSLITSAQTKAKMEQYEDALALLLSYPSTLSGYDKVAAAAVKIYEQWQSNVCGQIMQKARTAYSTGDYDTAAEMLGEVDMQSSCAADAKKLADEIRKAVGKERAEELQLYKEQLRTAAEIEKQRIKSAENVAKAYYQNRSSYVYLVW